MIGLESNQAVHCAGKTSWNWKKWSSKKMKWMNSRKRILNKRKKKKN